MDPTQTPSGGIPWVLAAPAFVFLVGVAIAAVKWVALRADRKIEEAEARVSVASAEKEKLRQELTAKIDALENEVQDELRKALDLAYSNLHGRPPRPAEPPPGVVRRKRTARELLEELGTVTGQYRRADIIGEITQDA